MTLIIVRDLLFFGKTTFKEFLECEENIATNILDDRLKKLVSEGILDYTGTEKRKKYFLTQKGKDLEPILIQMHNFSVKHVEGAEEYEKKISYK